MHVRLIAMAVFCVASLFASAASVSYKGVKPAVIIDVRTPEEFAGGHVAGALNIPYEQIASGIRTVKGLGKDQPILLYCRSGRRSGLAKQSLEQEGYKHILDGGGMEELVRNLKECSNKTC